LSMLAMAFLTVVRAKADKNRPAKKTSPTWYRWLSRKSAECLLPSSGQKWMKLKKSYCGHSGDDDIKPSPNTIIIRRDLNIMRNCSTKPDVLIPYINPKFGNLGEISEAQLAKKCSAKIAIPSYFGLFAEHGGDPGMFREQLQIHSPQTQLILLTPGRGIAI
jgi:hypothetical protein